MTRNRASETTEAGGRSKLTPGLYLVATPIGNLRDITLRAIDVLRAADVVACEDTRITARLMKSYEIDTPTIPYHDHNAARVRPALIKRLKAGEIVALVSDAGTPLVSDPGFKLVEACAEEGIEVVPIPGASALLAGLTAAGLPTDRFLFAGFPPNKSGARRRALEELAEVPATLVFYESGNRLAASLADMASVLGDRPAAVMRELTKLYEEVVRDGLGALAARYAEAGPPKGEIVVVVGPPVAAAVSDETIDQRLAQALAHLSVKDAAAEVAGQLGLPRRQLYDRALELLGRRGGAA